MKQTINYSDRSGDEKILAALQDIDNYYNGMRVNIPELNNRKLTIQDLFFDAIAEGESFKRISFLMNFSGVQGYPVIAFWKEVRNSLHTMTQ